MERSILMLKTTGPRLFGTFLGCIVLVVLLLTLNPFCLVPSTQVIFTFHSTLDNFSPISCCSFPLDSSIVWQLRAVGLFC
jgi:hypothetical protein